MIILSCVLSVIYSFMCWLAIYNTGKLNSLSMFIAGAMLGLALFPVMAHDYLAVASCCLPTIVILISYCFCNSQTRSGM